jgi:hypothetical protein
VVAIRVFSIKARTSLIDTDTPLVDDDSDA